jgi:ABC-type phosphate transport system substrate-binding protein
MKTVLRLSALALAVVMLAACSQPPAATASQQPGKSTAPTQASAAATAGTLPASAMETATHTLNPAFSPVPLPTGIVPDLPDPGNWAATLKLDPKDYPRVDGSTATIPLGIYMRSKITGESLVESTAATSFTTTGPAWEALAAGAADLLVVYEAPDVVKSKLNDMGTELTIKPIGLDALVFLTNRDNPVGGLTHQQIIDIYTGRITNWKEVGGNDVTIIPYQRPSNSGSQALMLKLVMKGTKMMDVPKILVSAEMGDLIESVASYANTNNALGYSVYYYVRNMYKLPGIKLLNINGVEPNANTIASGKYPYVNPFYAVIRTDEPAGSNTHKLFDWLTGAEGMRAITDAGYVPAQ